ncbi:MAG: hypothetical protein U0359_09245 [Byssovorax sp.]
MHADARWTALGAALLLAAGCGGSAAPDRWTDGSVGGSLRPPTTTAPGGPAATIEPAPGPPDMSDDGRWIPFDGEMVSSADPALLIDRYGRALQVPRRDVRQRHGKIELRLGSRTSRTTAPGRSPAGTPQAVQATPAAFDGECGGPAECVGLVRRCCGSGALVGFCMGLSDCNAGQDPVPQGAPP